MKYYAKHFFLLAVYFHVLVCLTYSFSQKQLTIIENEKMELLPALFGSANYSFYKEGSNRVYHGQFYFNSSQSDTLDIDQVSGLELSGNYKDGLKTDKWFFSKKLLQQEETGIAVREPIYSIIKKSSGSDFLIQANFDKGQAHGKWTVGDFKIDRGYISDTTFRAEANFNKNQFVGSFKSSGKNIEISGTLNDNGFLEGEWTLNHKKDNFLEKRVYEEGVLVKHIIFRNGNQLTVKHIGLDDSIGGENEEWDTLSLSEDYLNLLIFTQRIGDERNKELNQNVRKSNERLMYNISSFDVIDNESIWSITVGSKALQYPKVKVRKFSFEEGQKEEVLKVKKLLSKSEKILDDFLSDPQVNISKYSIEDVSLYYSVFKIYQSELVKLREVIDILSSYSAEYLDKSVFIPYIFQGTSFPDEVNYTFNDEDYNKKFDFPTNLSNNEVTIQNIIDHVNSVYNDLLEKENTIAPIIEENKKRAKIAENEKELVLKRDSIFNLFNNRNELDNYNSFHSRFAENVVNYVENEFKNYAIQPVEIRIEQIDSRLECFDSFLDFYAFLEDLPEDIKDIELLYTRTVWNPFTFTDMDETVKERVYNAYNRIILPHVLNELGKSIDCKQLAPSISNFNTVFQRMKILRNQDTQVLENRLKRMTNVDDVLREFELNLMTE
jgi:hypothetical protein